jgi:hypothetical protein
MGICHSAHDKNLSGEIKKNNITVNDNTFENEDMSKNKEQIEEKEKVKGQEIQDTCIRPSIFNHTEIQTSNNEPIKTNKKPELDKYERSMFISGQRSEYSQYNKTSMFSSGKTEEEVIIRGEINKEAKNLEEDFVNNSFKQLVKDNGGIIIKNNEMSNLFGRESHRTNPLFDLENENISEIHSKDSRAVGSNSGALATNSMRSYKPESYLSSNLSKGLFFPGNTSYNNSGYRLNERSYNSKYNSLNGTMNSKLKESSKINISMHESYPRVESYLNIPKVDTPLPDIDELSASILMNEN